METSLAQQLWRYGRTQFVILLLASTAASAQTTTPPVNPPPDCSHCKEKLLTLDALRTALPADWQLQREREPVFGSDVLVVQAGMQNPQTLLLVHGLGQNGFTDWLSVMPQLARRYHVITLDFPGFGYSSSPNGKYSPRNYARVLNWLLARHAKTRAIVVGHSMGGAVALRFASEYPAQLDKLILVDAAGILQRTAFVKYSARIPLPIEQMPSFLQGAVARITDFGNAAVEKIVGLPDPTRLLNTSETVWGGILSHRTNLNAAMALVDEDFSAAIPTLQTPTWIIWGEADPVAPLRTGQMLARRLPRAQLLTMPGVGHTPMETATSQIFYPLLEHALLSDPQPAPLAGSPGTELADLHCQGESGRLYSGHFREVLIEGCSGVKLSNLSAEHIVLRDSIVQMLNVQVDARDTALEVDNSELIATAGEISGDIAIRADKARIDLAGFKLDARRTAIEVQRFSRLVGSVNAIRSPAYTGTWQGSEEIEMGVLAP
ncbi:MAG: alpha/beta hydrolase [Proteobacteria bacterium]|nr:alpha/beta hydrolase [Pseudomonadota bacterium]